MRISDSTLQAAVSKFEGAKFSDKVWGLSSDSVGVVYAGEVLAALLELRNRRAQDAWVVRQMLGKVECNSQEPT